MWFQWLNNGIFSFRYAEKAEASKRKVEFENNKENVEVKNAYVTSTSRNSTLFIMVSSLYQQISDKSKTLLLMDCRSEQAFLESKISFSNLINIPEELIDRG